MRAGVVQLGNDFQLPHRLSGSLFIWTALKILGPLQRRSNDGWRSNDVWRWPECNLMGHSRVVAGEWPSITMGCIVVLGTKAAASN